METLPFERIESAAAPLAELASLGVAFSYANFRFFTLTVPQGPREVGADSIPKIAGFLQFPRAISEESYLSFPARSRWG